ncbi:MAG: dihydrolipoamide acetyltransferase family protein [Phycisphaerales bacterium]
MPIKIEMPRLSDTMQAGTVVKWNVKEGQAVKSGDVLADIETDKATMELPSYDDGTVAAILAAEGQNIPIGTAILVLAAKGESVEQARAAAGGASANAAPVRASAGGATSASRAASGATAVAEPPASVGNDIVEPRVGRVFASPLARKVAADAGVDLAALQGTGPGGRIVRKDVEAARGGTGLQTGASGRVSDSRAAQLTAAHVPPMPEAMIPPAGAMLTTRTVPLSNMRRIIAERLVQSKTTIPHYQVTVEADVDALLALRTTLNEQLASQGVKLSVNDFLVRACALAMHQHPFVNSKWIKAGADRASDRTEAAANPSIEIIPDVNIGVAIALPEERGGGLVVATIRNADRLGLRQISTRAKTLAEKARAKGLTVEEMADSTFTISNLGMFGVEHFTAIINPPNVAILAVGAAVLKPVVKDGNVVPGHRMSMTMSSDHRVVDGAMAAQYLATVKGMLERPATLLV